MLHDLLSGAIHRTHAAAQRPFSRLSAIQCGLLLAASLSAVPMAAHAADINVLHAFNSSTEGLDVFGHLVEDPNTPGTYYGMTSFGTATIFKITNTGTFTVLYTFSSASTALKFSYGGLVFGSDGKLYGTTYYGGANAKGGVFQFDPSTSTFTDIHDFAGTADGAYPYSTLVEDASGYLWGTVSSGAANGVGGVYKIAKDGSGFTLEHSFNTTDGKTPYAGLTLAADKAFYGVTHGGGANSRGVIYKIASDGTYTLLNSFPASATTLGTPLYSGLIQASDGRLYGTTNSGGTYSRGGIYGINTDGSNYGEVYDFTGGTDGSYPQTGLVEDSTGGLVGVTTNGGGNNYGEIYRVTKSGDYTGLYAMTYYNGSYAAFLQASDGNLYGVTNSGNSSLGQGTGYIYQFDYAAPDPVPTIDLSWTTNPVTLGKSTTLAWNTVNASSCTATGAWAGNQSINGGITITPTALGTFTYGMTCTGSGGHSSSSIDLTVVQPVMTVSLTPARSSLIPGEKLRMSWATQYATSCTASGDWSGSLPVNGADEFRIGTGAATRTYTLTCEDAYGNSQSSTATVTVKQPGGH